MCKALGLEVEYIEGYGKIDDKVPTSSNHAWNAVKIDNSYYLVDVAWGSGKCNGDTFQKSYTDYYFCPKPECFIREHLPLDNKWQLLPKIITFQQFSDMAYLTEDFYKNGFLAISPDNHDIDINGKTKIYLSYNESQENFNLFIKLFYFENNKLNEIKNSYLFYKEKGIIEIDIIANYEKSYMLIMYGGPSNLESYPPISYMFLNNLKVSTSPIYYPFEYSLGMNGKLIEPLNGNLTQGTFVDFKIKSNSFDNIFIIIDDYFEREFEKLDGGIFYGESVYIFGKEVIITTYERGVGHHLLYRYTTVKNPNMEKEPSFPENSIELPPHVLYSPIIDTLKKGNSYFFKIKCKSATEMFVFDGENMHDLTKNDDHTFSKQITIDKTATQVVIAGYLSNSEDTTIFYIYKTS